MYYNKIKSIFHIMTYQPTWKDITYPKSYENSDATSKESNMMIHNTITTTTTTKTSTMTMGMCLSVCFIVFTNIT